ncbi:MULTISPECIES: LysR family transcriptional regulator [Novosphingobium]|uniref:LysR family transcriptional regulator n=1 Tax=Novosphingobium TaxID=165696 RepID=UPI001CD1E7EE|nr:LysR family transcriptional regulator [Novosphingobium percolationis]MCH7629901.1 LysR family transcriptional regulator [Pseudomonadota bacterium]
MATLSLEWSDLPVFLAIAREGTLGRAARSLGQSQPTMGRRLRALEDAMGLTLFQRTADGFVLTDEGAVMLRHAERMEAEAQALSRELAGSSGGLEGMLRLTCSDWFGRIVLAPVLAEFHRLHPGVIVETLTDQRVYSLGRREADLVFRITGFDEPEVIARRLMTVPYAVYGQIGRWCPRPGDGEAYPVVVMDTAFGTMPDVGWLLQTLPGARIVARSNSREIQAELCGLGTGLAVLPKPLGNATPGIELLDLGDAPPARDTWLGYHRDLKRLPRLRALVELMIDRLVTKRAT